MLIDHVGHKTKSPGAAALGLFYVYLYLKSTEVYNPFYCMKSKILCENMRVITMSCQKKYETIRAEGRR